MKYIITLLLVTTLVSCRKDDLKSEFNCKTSKNSYELKEYRDILKKYRIELPTNWKTELYYDEFQSEIYSADTTKGLTKTYILDISWHQGELNLDAAFEQTVKDTLSIKEGLNLVKSNFGKFHKMPSYYNLSKGKNGKYTYHFLQVYVKTEIDEYFTFTTKLYGDDEIDERLCESISLIDNIKFLR